MLLSMTGFGKAHTNFENKTILIEVRSLNSQKGLDLSLKFSTQFREQEYELRNLIAEKLLRGKVDVYVTIEKDDKTPEILLNKRIITAYFNELKAIATELGVSSDNLLPVILQMPEIAASSREESNEQEWKAVEKAIILAIDDLCKFRVDEGQILARDMAQRIATIQQYALEVAELDKARIPDIKARMKSNVELAVSKEKMDANRLEQELLYYIEKLDITEELTRLRSHCDYWQQIVDGGEEQKGRKLNFIAQEIGREINTLGAKANHAIMQKLVVSMKDELEKIKEQINNIL